MNATPTESVHEAKSFCRMCIAACGVVLTIDQGRITGIRGDRDHPISKGYACFKGLQAVDAHHGAARQLHTLQRTEGGSFQRVGTEQALDDIAQRLAAIVARDGPNAVALFRGTAGFHTSTAFRMHGEFLRALGSTSLYTTLTIDQSAKYIAAGRLGTWHAGQIHIDDAEVLLMFGCNPLVSHSAGGMLVSDPVKRLKLARARGMKLIVVDPRESETARHADIFLQPIPGTDAVVAAGLLRLILAAGLHDADFCAAHVLGLDTLRRTVEPFTPEVVAQRAGIGAEDLRAAALLFAQPSRRGAVITGTGTNMAPHSNLAEHLIQCLDVVCGHFKRAGERMPHFDPLQPPVHWYADVVAPTRPWDALPASRIRGVGHLYGEKLTATLADEILTPGPGQIKALVIDGANIANSVPDKARMLQALRSLELLVVIDPHLTPTAEQAHYVFSPKLQYERDDLPLTLGRPLYADAWTQYAPAAIAPPPGSDVVDDWYVFFALARRMGLPLQYGGQAMAMDRVPTSEELLSMGLHRATVTLADIQHSADGIWDGRSEPNPVLPARPGAGRFAVAPQDVVDELHAIAAEPRAEALEDNAFQLISRRMRDVNGSLGMHTASIRQRNPYNPLHMHGDDLARLQLIPGQRVRIRAQHGGIVGIVKPDNTLRRGVVSMSHNWGRADNDPASFEAHGASTNLLISADRAYEAINAMPHMSAIPVSIEAYEERT
nr:molybdopterin-dependent oxidoreductase [uncultured Albidiferax sp.]